VGGGVLSRVLGIKKGAVPSGNAPYARYRAKYPEWWLVLPDHIGYGLDDFEQELFLDQVTVQYGGFDKIVLLDPRDASRTFEVWP